MNFSEAGAFGGCHKVRPIFSFPLQAKLLALEIGPLYSVSSLLPGHFPVLDASHGVFCYT